MDGDQKQPPQEDSSGNEGEVDNSENGSPEDAGSMSGQHMHQGQHQSNFVTGQPTSRICSTSNHHTRHPSYKPYTRGHVENQKESEPASDRVFTSVVPSISITLPAHGITHRFGENLQQITLSGDRQQTSVGTEYEGHQKTPCQLLIKLQLTRPWKTDKEKIGELMEIIFNPMRQAEIEIQIPDLREITHGQNLIYLASK